MRYRIWKYYHRGPVSRTEVTNAKVPVWTEQAGNRCLNAHIHDVSPEPINPRRPGLPVAAAFLAVMGLFLAWMFGWTL